MLISGVALVVGSCADYTDSGRRCSSFQLELCPTGRGHNHTRQLALARKNFIMMAPLDDSEKESGRGQHRDCQWHTLRAALRIPQLQFGTSQWWRAHRETFPNLYHIAYLVHLTFASANIAIPYCND